MVAWEFRKTYDNSLTAFSTKYNESCHSPHGAKREAFLKHANFATLKEDLKVLDFCFGLGYNSAAIIDLFVKSPYEKITIIGIEIDRELVEGTMNLKAEFASFGIIVKMIEKGLLGEEYNCIFEEKEIKTKLYVDDCIKVIPQLKEEYFDIVFFDPFTSKTSPQLWTVEMFKEVNRVLKKGGILTTYSCSKTVRSNMQMAGFEAREAPDMDKGHPGTIGIKK